MFFLFMILSPLFFSAATLRQDKYIRRDDWRMQEKEKPVFFFFQKPVNRYKINSK